MPIATAQNICNQNAAWNHKSFPIIERQKGRKGIQKISLSFQEKGMSQPAIFQNPTILCVKAGFISMLLILSPSFESIDLISIITLLMKSKNNFKIPVSICYI